MKKTKAIVYNEKDGVVAFGLYVILPMALACSFMSSNVKAPFDSQHAPIDHFQIKDKKISLIVPVLGNKKFEIKTQEQIKPDSKLFAAYQIDNGRLTDLKTVSYNGKIIWINVK